MVRLCVKLVDVERARRDVYSSIYDVVVVVAYTPGLCG